MYKAKGYCEGCWNYIYREGTKEEILQEIYKIDCCSISSYILYWEEVEDKNKKEEGGDK